MKSTKFVLMGLFLTLITISAPVMATGNGDVTIWVNGYPQGDFYYCMNNIVSIVIANDAPLYEFSLGFQLDWGPRIPVVSPQLEVVYPLHDFEISLQADTSDSATMIYIHCTANGAPLQANSLGMAIFRVLVFLPDPDTNRQVCIDNVVNPATMDWSFRDVAYYSPSFNGVANAGLTDPSAPTVCYDVFEVPDCIPQFSATPPDSVSISHCDPFAFDFQVPLLASERCKDRLPDVGSVVRQDLFEGAWYSCLKGSIDSVTGEYVMGPSMTNEAVQEVVSAHSNSGCSVTDYAFTIVRTGAYAPPSFAACRPIVRVKTGNSKVINYRSPDPYQCTSQNWSLSLLSGTAPESNVSIDSVGKVTVIALASDLGETFDYRLIAADLLGNADSCEVQVQIVSYLPGDANGDDRISISDVVQLINCIFGGPGCTIGPPMDANCSGNVNISDVVYLVNHIFAGGPAPCL